MAKVLTDVEVQEILEEYRANGELSEYEEGPEYFIQSPLSLAQGYGRSMQLRPGLTLNVTDVEKHRVYLFKINQHPQPMPLTLSYYLSGGCRVENDGLKISHEEVAGKGYLYCLPNTAELENYPAGPLCRVLIQISPELVSTFSDRLHELPTPLRQAIEQPEKALLYVANTITPGEQHILRQILQWPYQGITRQFYLEAKVLELLALYFDQMLNKTDSPQLLASEVDRIYQAQDILNQTMVQPPSISELARQVQLNERKLKEGFRQVFNTTVFGYLTQQRMQKACYLLTQQRSISAVATTIGYASSTAFSNAFRRQFGMSPKGYQLEQRRTFS